MRHIKILRAIIVAIVALSATAAATAMAAAPEFSPGAEGTKFSGTSPSGKLEVKGEPPVECEKDSVTGHLIGTTKKEAEADVSFTGCKAFDIFGAHSLEDPEGQILVTVRLLLCYISETPVLEVGVLTKIVNPVHIEVAGKLLVVTGDQVAKITPVNGAAVKTFKLEYKQAGGVPKPVGCLDEKEHYSTEINESKKPIESGEETTEETEFALAQKLVG